VLESLHRGPGAARIAILRDETNLASRLAVDGTEAAATTAGRKRRSRDRVSAVVRFDTAVQRA
jgi:hypothetical protein